MDLDYLEYDGSWPLANPSEQRLWAHLFDLCGKLTK